MVFRSILYAGDEAGQDLINSEEPDFFTDLNLDQLVASITLGRSEYSLEPFFYSPVTLSDIGYRHQVLRDLARPALRQPVEAFGKEMGTLRDHLKTAGELRYRYQQQRWFLDCVDFYCQSVVKLADELQKIGLSAPGWLAFAEFIQGYRHLEAFTTLQQETAALKESLSKVRYRLHIKGARIRVSKGGGDPDFGEDVLAVFAKFQETDASNYRVKFPDYKDMNHVEAAILSLVVKLHPDTFQALGSYCNRHQDFRDDTVRAFDREVQFYLGYLTYLDRLSEAGLSFSYPAVSESSKEVHVAETFDLVLANHLVDEQLPVVCNDLSLTGPERIIVVTGPNQGGKTTLARTFGQLHYLARLGLPVPGRDAQLFCFDQLFSHFEKEEKPDDLRGKLQDELVRLHEILSQASDRSIIIMNEIFTSTTLDDAEFLGEKLMERVMELDVLCVYVTFVDELATLGTSTVSMVATVEPDQPAERTYKVIRRRADGLAYAAAIARKYGLTYDSLKDRIAS